MLSDRPRGRRIAPKILINANLAWRSSTDSPKTGKRITSILSFATLTMGSTCYKRNDSLEEWPPSIPSSPSGGLDSEVGRIMKIARKGRNWDYVLELIARQQKTGIFHYVDQYGRSLLHYAAEQGEVKALERILTYGADVNGLDLSKHSPLGFAAASGSLKCVELLLRHKADVNAVDIHGHGPLYAAACRGHLAVVKSVVEHNARTYLLHRP